MKKPKKLILSLIILTILSIITIPEEIKAFCYTTKANVNMRTGPGLNYKVVEKLSHNLTLNIISKKNEWYKIKTIRGKTGFVRQDMISEFWIKIHKTERDLFVIQGKNKIVMSCKIGLSDSNPLGDKKISGDSGTPEGRFFLCEMIKKPKKTKYGARSMRISYPAIEDARRGLKAGIISMNKYLQIVKSIRNGYQPDQRSKLGGSIRIHGGGSSSDWTLGCIGVEDKDIREVYKYMKKSSRVEIFKSAMQDKKLASSLYLNKKILEGAKKQLLKPALYTAAASGIIRLQYPSGDIPEDEAVCTDIIIRSLRHSGIDLQALIYEDSKLKPDRYKPWIKKPNYHIDQRRVRNQKKYFDYHAISLTSDTSKIAPGDIVIMDTGIRNGTKLDHIGIVDDIKNSDGNYQVINIWTTGERTESYSLIGLSYPEIICFFRLTHPFDYHALL